MLRYRVLFVLSACFLLLNAASAAESNFKLGYGLHHGKGYFEHASNSDVTAVTVAGSYRLSQVDELKLALSYNQVERADGNAIQGLGDAIVGYKRRTVFAAKRRLLDWDGKIKLPTADESDGMGTGEVDYTLAATAYQRAGNNWLLMTLGYKWRGDARERPMNDGYLAKVGAVLTLDPRYSAGGSLDYSEAASPRSGDRRESTIYWNYKYTQRVKLTFYATKGFSDASPQWAGGFQLSQTF